MHEDYKLTEARYFLERMRAERDNRVAFRFELSAFLSAARSVLQYALQEAKAKLGGNAWYDQAMRGSEVLIFFKGQRDNNVHALPVRPTPRMQTSMAEHLRFVDEDAGEEAIIPFPHHTSSNSYRFDTWNGAEDVFELAERCCAELQLLIEDGVAQGFISG